MKIAKILKVYYSNYIFNLIIKNTSAYGLDALLFLFIDANGKKMQFALHSVLFYYKQSLYVSFILFTQPNRKQNTKIVISN